MTRPRKSQPKPKQASAKTLFEGMKQVNVADLVPLPHVNPPVWIDRVEFTVRADAQVAMLRLLTMVSPENTLEVFRAQTTVNHLAQIAEVICRILNYYPEKPPQGKAAKNNGKT